MEFSNIESSAIDGPGGAVAAVEQLAADAGAAILRVGGNAGDASVAAAFAQCVVNPVISGIGGGGSGLFYDAKTRATEQIWSLGRSPHAAQPTMFKPAGHWATQFRVEGATNQFGYLASITPGFVKGMALIYERHGSGRVAWGALLGPAIELASEGFQVYPYLYSLWAPENALNDFVGVGAKTVGFSAPGRDIFLHEDGSVLSIGETLVQRDLGETLERIAKYGADEFYLGETGEKIAADFAANGGILSKEDLEEFGAEVYAPLTGHYQGLGLVTEDAPSTGPTFLELMNILECGGLRELEHNSADYLALLVRAINRAFEDRAEFIGDPSVVEVPLERLLSKEYAESVLAEINQEARSESGDHFSTLAPKETTHVSVVDGEGNAAAITHSTGSGSGVITEGLGFMHNNHMIMFDPRPERPNSLGGWKRPNAGGAPVMVFAEGSLSAVMGSPGGGRKVTAMAQVLVNLADFAMNMQEAVDAPRIHAEDIPLEVSVEPRFDPRTTMELVNRGFSVQVESYGGRVEAVRRLRDGSLEVGTDPRGDQGQAVVGAIRASRGQA
jgi:gamma-glutamyltranspeptidase/glutathione hydrolase